MDCSLKSYKIFQSCYLLKTLQKPCVVVILTHDLCSGVHFAGIGSCRNGTKGTVAGRANQVTGLLTLSNRGIFKTNLWLLCFREPLEDGICCHLARQLETNPEVTCWALRSSQVLGAGRSWPCQGHCQWGDTGMMIIVPWNSEWILHLNYLPQNIPPWHDQHSPSHQWLTSPKVGE